MTKFGKLAGLGVAASLLLSGCASVFLPAEPESKPAPSAPQTTAPSTPTQAPVPTGPSRIDSAPATGPKVVGIAYSFVAPEGWVESYDALLDPSVDTFAVSTTPIDGFSENLNVVISPAGFIPVDMIEVLAVAELESVGGTDVVVQDRLILAGSEIAHISAKYSLGTLTYNVEQYYLNYDDSTYIATFAFGPSVSEADRIALANSVLVTWEWN